MLSKVRTFFQARACSTERPSSAPRNLPELALPEVIRRNLRLAAVSPEIEARLAEMYATDPDRCFEEAFELKLKRLREPNTTQAWLYEVAREDKGLTVHHEIVQHPNAPLQLLATTSPYPEIRIEAVRRDTLAAKPVLRPAALGEIAQWAVANYIKIPVRQYFWLLERIASHPNVTGEASSEFRLLSPDEQHRLLYLLKSKGRWHAVWILIRDTKVRSVGKDGARYLIDHFPEKINTVTIEYIWKAAEPKERERLERDWGYFIEGTSWGPWRD